MSEVPDEKQRIFRRREYQPDAIRLLPQAISAERDFVAAAMLEPGWIAKGRERRIASDHFASPANAIIWARLLAMDDAQVAVDFTTLTTALRDAGELDQCGGAANITALFTELPTTANAAYHLAIIEEKHLLRETIKGCTQIVGDCYDSQDDIPGIRTLAETLLARVADPDILKKTARPVRQVVLSVMQKVSVKDTEAIWGIPTGFANLDAMARGLRSGNMIAIGGQTSAGKTSFALNIVWNVCVRRSIPVLVFSFEMTTDEVTESLLQIGSGVNIDNLLEGKFTDDENANFNGAAQALAAAPLTIRDDTDLDILQIRSIARRLRPRVIVIDYAQLCRGGAKKYERRDLEIADVSRNAKNMAGELNATVILITQLNDDGKVSDSRAIAKDANQLWTVEDGGEEDTKCVAVAKQRRGKKDVANFAWIGACQKFLPKSVR